MEKKVIGGYFFFGTAVRYLQDIEAGNPLFGDGKVLYNIDRCLHYIDQLELKVTKIAARNLVDFRKKLGNTKDKKAILTPIQSSELNSICTTLRSTLESELQMQKAFVVTPKRFDTNRLLYDVGSLMSPDVFLYLPEITKYDMNEAGKCIAFERPTAAAFHLLRGTEAVLRFFYCTLIHTKRVPNLLWGDMTEDLRHRTKTKQHTTLYNNLDNIRHSYRNPTQHPEAVYDIHEVQDLCPLCFEVINRMVKILKPT
jgi:hypothetical protein